ncbi:MAG: ribonuclease D [Eggerthellales bacterium]|nr:ribonuclease D [Eggerthellales bacterium]
MLITDQKQFKAFVNRAKNSSLLCIDTEFLREKTYWAQLCLLQISTDQEAVAIDPFAVKDLRPLVPLLEDPGIVKVFHAAHQDLEIIHHELGVIPRPIFDTQVAAALLCDNIQIGYGPLVSMECGVHLKKADSYTDWSRRPLTDSQIQYALDDVIYLPDLYKSMTKKLADMGRLDWLTPDFQDMVDPEHFDPDPDERFLKLKRVNQLHGAQIAIAQKVCAWRERQAMRRNVPRKWIITDEQVLEICKREPKTLDDLFIVRNVKRTLSMADSRAVLALCLAALESDPSTWPTVQIKSKPEANVDAQVDLMSALVRQRARESGLAFGVLASHDDLVSIARGKGNQTQLMRGWRKEIVGEELQALCNGEIGLCVNNGAVTVTPVLWHARTSK